MSRSKLFVMFTLGLCMATTAFGQGSPLDRYVYPLAKEQKAPTFTIDVKESPESLAWAQAAKSLAERWYPIIVSLLATQDYRSPKQIRLVFRAKQDAPAWASGDEISVNAEWVKAHPDDLGMIIHELAHIVQAYPENKVDTGWLVEGIADYIRWWRYEPESPRPNINPDKASYRDAYRTTAAFLAWASRKYDMRLVPTLDKALRKGEDPMPLFAAVTGKDADALWAEFITGYKK